MDWQKYRLPIMGVLALALGGVTWWVVTQNTGDSPVVEGEEAPTLPEVDTDALTELEIRRPAAEGEEAEVIRLVKDGDTWRLAAPVEAPATQAAVTTALEKLGDLEVRGRAASGAQHHEAMEVDAAHGVRVIARAGSETVIDLYVGAFRAGNTLVRQEGDDTVLMVQGSIKFAFNKPPRDWRERSITELTASQVTHASFTNEHGAWSFEKRGDAWTQVLTAPEGGEAPAPIEEFDGTKVATMVSSLARLRASDFAPSDATPESLGFGEGAARVVLGLTETAEAEDGEDPADEGGEAGDDAPAAPAEDDAAATPLADPTRTVTIFIGNEQSEGQRYVMLEGNDTIFVVSRFVAERLLPEAEDFTASAEPPTPPPSPGGMPGGMPGMPGMPGGGGGQIPPEVMRQIQQQLQQQGAAGGGGH